MMYHPESADDWFYVLKNFRRIINPTLKAIAQKKKVAIIRAEMRATHYELAPFPNLWITAMIEVNIDWSRFYFDPWDNQLQLRFKCTEMFIPSMPQQNRQAG